jgi:molybdenum cofactor cytidylyltransferase
MGRPKLLLPWGQQTVLGQTVQNVLTVTKNVLIVTGAYAAQTSAIAATWNVPTVHNSEYANGEMISSLQAALRVCGAADAFFVMLADMPLVAPETMRAIVAHWERRGGIVVPTFEGERGHPVVFSAEFIPALLSLHWSETPRTVVQANRDNLHLFPVTTPSILVDLDTPERYNHWHTATFPLESQHHQYHDDHHPLGK